MREVDPEEDGDRTDEALQLLNAGGINRGLNIQFNASRVGWDAADGISRVSSMRNSGSLRGFDSNLLCEDDLYASPRGQPPMEATRELLKLHRHAEKLAAQQQELEAQATARWSAGQVSTAPGGKEKAWVGGLIPAVDIDEWGSFSFLVIRLCDNSGRQRIVIQGRNEVADEDILERVRAQVMTVVG